MVCGDGMERQRRCVDHASPDLIVPYSMLIDIGQLYHHELFDVPFIYII